MTVFDWDKYLATRFIDPAASLAWQIIVRDPFYLYDGGNRFIERQSIEYPSDGPIHSEVHDSK